MNKIGLFYGSNVILLMVLYVLCLKLKKGHKLKTVAYYLFPTFVRTDRLIAKLITAIIDSVLIWRLLPFEFNLISMVSDAFSIIVILILVDWIVFVSIELFLTVHKYILWKFNDTWYFIFVASCFIIIFETFVDFTGYPLLSSLYRMESILLLFFGFMYISKLTINIITNKGDVFPEIYIKKQEQEGTNDADLDKLLSIVSVISIQIIYYTSLLCVLVNRNIMDLELTGTRLYNLIDMAYFVIITYTSVGYGDILPSTIIAKIVVCCISISGFLTSVAVIGELIGMHSANKSQD